eukprot:COSAG01_NODE_26_length_36857_cov_31.426166_32_plen_804_part_00
MLPAAGPTLLRRVALQLDYHMSAQFAGLAVAMQRGMFADANIHFTLMPTCPPGDETTRVLAAQRQATTTDQALTILGCTEQNVLVYDSHANAAPVSAVGAMFATTPLALAALPGADLHTAAEASSCVSPTNSLQAQHSLRVGAHIDTVELLERLLPHAHVTAVPREDKLQLLRCGDIDAVQVYDVTEPLRLHEDLGAPPELLKLEDLAGGHAELGYSQVLFVADEVLGRTDDLHHSSHRDIIRATCEVIFAGWACAIRDPEAAARDVAALVPRGQLGELSGAAHWRNSHDFLTRSVIRSCEYVKQTRRGDKLGTIDPARWQRANSWLRPSSKSTSLGLDRTCIYGIDPRWMPGHDVAAALSKKIKETATDIRKCIGRRPSLLVITVGNAALGEGHIEAEPRLKLLAAPNSSWYSKCGTGKAHGIAVTEMHLPAETTTQQLLHVLGSLRVSDGGKVTGAEYGIYDGVQVMWPLPPSICARTVYSAIPRELDADGAQWLGDMHLAAQRREQHVDGCGPAVVDAHPMPPVTPAAVLHMLAHYNIPVCGKHALVVGRSRIVGQPLAYKLGQAGATVTVMHSHTSQIDLKRVASYADLVISCVGIPGIISAKWLKEGATAISIGSCVTESGSVLPDIEGLGEVAAAHVRRYSTVPGGVGPITVLKLLENVLVGAGGHAKRVNSRPLGATSDTPTLSSEALQSALAGDVNLMQWSVANAPGRLTRTFWLPTYPCAVSFVAAISDVAEEHNHHPDLLEIKHRCVDGVDVTVALCTWSKSGITAFDLALAQEITTIFDARHDIGAKRSVTS